MSRQVARLFAMGIAAFATVSPRLQSEPILRSCQGGTSRFSGAREYVGEIDGKKGHLKLGVQVVAREGRIRRHDLSRGLARRRLESGRSFGSDSRQDGRGRHRARRRASQRQDQRRLAGHQQQVRPSPRRTEKIERRSPTLGMKPSEGPSCCSTAPTPRDGKTASSWRPNCSIAA